MRSKLIVSAALAVGAMFGIGSASAADMAVKAAPVVAPAFSWTGCYIGVHAGGGVLLDQGFFAGGLNDKHGDFSDREAVVLAASTDSVHSHLGWVKADQRLANLKYPILADMTKSISRDYGVLLEDAGIALRGTFIIDPNGVLRWAQYNDLDTGRNIDEIIRVLDALQTGKLCPCDWKKGEATLG